MSFASNTADGADPAAAHNVVTRQVDATEGSEEGQRRDALVDEGVEICLQGELTLLFIYADDCGNLKARKEEEERLKPHFPLARWESTVDAHLLRVAQLWSTRTTRIAHFVGHATQDGLQLGGRNVSAADLTGVFRLRSPDLLFLNACVTATLASQLQHLDIPAIISWSIRVADSIASAFSSAFYDAFCGNDHKGCVHAAFIKALKATPQVDPRTVKLSIRPECLAPNFSVVPIGPKRSIQQASASLSLPPHYAAPTTHYEQAVSGLLSPQTSIVGVLGAGGIGKTSLVIDITCNRTVRCRFPGGAYWLELGPDPKLPQLVEEVLSQLPSDARRAAEDPTLAVRNYLKRHATLLVLDDLCASRGASGATTDIVQASGVLDFFFDLINSGEGGSKILASSRDESAFRPEAHRVKLELLDSGKARQLLLDWAGLSAPSSAPLEFEQLLSLCGGLPAALRSAGALVSSDRNSPSVWRDVLSALQTGIENAATHHSLPSPTARLMDALIYGSLRRHADLIPLYHDLHIFHARSALPIAVFTRLGCHTTAAVTALEKAALITCSNGLIVLHDLHREFLARSLSADVVKERHAEIVAQFGLQSGPVTKEVLRKLLYPPTGKDDATIVYEYTHLREYVLQNYVWHLCMAGHETRAAQLLFSFAWIRAVVSASKGRNGPRNNALLNSSRILLSDALMVLNRLSSTDPMSAPLRLLAVTLQQSARTLRAEPRQLLSQLVGRLAFMDQCPAPITNLLREGIASGRRWLMPLNQNLHSADGAFHARLPGWHGSGPLLLCSSGRIYAHGVEAGSVRVWDSTSLELDVKRTISEYGNLIGLFVTEPERFLVVLHQRAAYCMQVTNTGLSNPLLPIVRFDADLAHFGFASRAMELYVSVSKAGSGELRKYTLNVTNGTFGRATQLPMNLPTLRSLCVSAHSAYACFSRADNKQTSWLIHADAESFIYASEVPQVNIERTAVLSDDLKFATILCAGSSEIVAWKICHSKSYPPAAPAIFRLSLVSPLRTLTAVHLSVSSVLIIGSDQSELVGVWRVDRAEREGKEEFATSQVEASKEELVMSVSAATVSAVQPLSLLAIGRGAKSDESRSITLENLANLAQMNRAEFGTRLLHTQAPGLVPSLSTINTLTASLLDIAKKRTKLGDLIPFGQIGKDLLMVGKEDENITKLLRADGTLTSVSVAGWKSEHYKVLPASYGVIGQSGDYVITADKTAVCAYSTQASRLQLGVYHFGDGEVLQSLALVETAPTVIIAHALLHTRAGASELLSLLAPALTLTRRVTLSSTPSFFRLRAAGSQLVALTTRSAYVLSPEGATTELSSHTSGDPGGLLDVAITSDGSSLVLLRRAPNRRELSLWQVHGGLILSPHVPLYSSDRDHRRVVLFHQLVLVLDRSGCLYVFRSSHA